jgi:hypothetical protein
VGALSAPGGYYTGIADGGLIYSYADGNGSTACVDANNVCVMGTTAAGNGTGNIWGGGIGIHLNQADSTTAPDNEYLVPSTSTGIYYSVSNVPATQGLRIVTDDATTNTEYCAVVSAASGSVPWTSFNSTCWQPSTGTYLKGPPTYSRYIQFQAPAVYAIPGTFNFCVTSVYYP